MKKIGIITIHNCKSFGACLQTYALYQYFLNIGYDCEVIDLRRKEQPNFVKSRKYRPYYRDESYIVPIKRFIKKKLHLSPQVEDSSILNFEKFYSLIKLSSEYRSVDELYKNPPIYDIYVTGSDQVWNPYQPYCIEPYFLTFAPQGKKRISFAASIGVEYVENNILQDYKKWLSDYDFISVREKEAKMLLSTLTNKNIEVVSDPTFLLDISSWNSLCKDMNISTPYILLFSLSFQHELLDYVLKLHANSEFILVVLGANQPTIVQDNVIQFKDAGPIEFLSLIRGAKMVFTDSFHGTVFSLILGVDNFYTYIAKGNKRGSRILNLLERFGLNDHLLKTEVTDNLNEMFNLPINHQKVLGVISEIQKHDKDVLQYMLK